MMLGRLNDVAAGFFRRCNSLTTWKGSKEEKVSSSKSWVADNHSLFHKKLEI